MFERVCAADVVVSAALVCSGWNIGMSAWEAPRPCLIGCFTTVTSRPFSMIKTCRIADALNHGENLPVITARSRCEEIVRLPKIHFYHFRWHQCGYTECLDRALAFSKETTSNSQSIYVLYIVPAAL